MQTVSRGTECESKELHKCATLCTVQKGRLECACRSVAGNRERPESVD